MFMEHKTVKAERYMTWLGYWGYPQLPTVVRFSNLLCEVFTFLKGTMFRLFS